MLAFLRSFPPRRLNYSFVSIGSVSETAPVPVLPKTRHERAWSIKEVTFCCEGPPVFQIADSQLLGEITLTHCLFFLDGEIVHACAPERGWRAIVECLEFETALPGGEVLRVEMTQHFGP